MLIEVLIISILIFFQSIFGVGLLLFGTPTFLLLNYNFLDTLNILLPISVSISFLQLIYSKKKNLEFKNNFNLFTLPFLVFSLFLVINFIDVINNEILNQLCAPNIPIESTCEYVSLFESYKNSLKINGENIFNKGTTKFALSQYGLYIQFWEYDFYGASGSELILLPWIVLEDVLDKNGKYVDTFMKAYCVYDKYEFTEYEPMWEWVCES